MSLTVLDTTTVRRWTRYSEYRPSGAEWLPQLPKQWQVKRLKYLAAPSRRRLFEKPDDATYIGLEQIESKTGKLLLDNPVETVESNMGVFDRGDVLFGKLRPYLAKVAAPTFAGVCTTELTVYRPKPEVQSEYLKYQMLVGDFIDFVNALAYGTKMPRVSEEQMSEIRLAVPPLAEQRAIAAFLDREVARIDALIGHKERLIGLLEEKRQAIISHAVTRGLDPTVPLKDSGVMWLGMVPEHWQVHRMKWVAKLESGHTPDKKIEAYWTNCDIPWVSLNDTGYLKDHDYISDTAYQVNQLGLANSSARLLPARAVVFSRDATIGRCAITTRPMAVSQHFIAWLCRDSIIPEYLLRVLRAMQQELERLTMGATIKTIGMPDVRSLTTPVPPVPEQEKIVRHIETQTASIDNARSRIRDNIDLLREHRMALISAAVTGQIDVRDEVTL